MRRSLLAMSISTVLLSSVYAQQVQPDTGMPVPPSPGGNASIPMTYVGSDGRISLGVTDNGDVQGEGLGVFGYNGQRAWIGQFWLGQGGAGGVQFDYNWLWGKTRQDSIDAPDSVTVAKSFVAFDQNEWHDRKATIGIGAEKQDKFLTGYVMGALTGQRFVDSSTSSVQSTLSGSDSNGNFTQTQTITTLIDYFERPYNYGVGLRGGSYFDDGSFRLHAGLDYEKGRIGADQATLSVGADKYIANSGWSLSVLGEHLKKSGPFETDTSDDRGWLFVRYEFGHENAFRPSEPFKMVQVEKQVPIEAPAPESQVIRNDVRLDTDAYFGFDQAALQPEAVRDLDDMITKLKSGARVSKVTVTGHTCNIGTAEYNQALSVRRAQAVRAYLIQRGIEADEIEAVGEGMNNPKYPNDTEANRHKNRRVDIEFLTIEETVVPAKPLPPSESKLEWITEPVKMPAAWIERALRNPADHKRTVDVYKIQQQTVSTTLGAKQYAPKPPVAVDDTAALNNCAPVMVAVLANDSDPQGQTLTVTSVGNATYGTPTINGGASVTYTPRAGTSGAACTTPPAGQGDSFVYTIKDTSGLTASATVHLTPNVIVNLPPIAKNDSATTPAGVPVVVNVLSNDSDPQNFALTVTSVATPAHGTAVINADNTVTYTPSAGFSGADSFNYSISDGHGGTATAKVSITVTPVVQNPVAKDDSATTPENVAVIVNVLANDSDPGNFPLSVKTVTAPAHGTASINADNSVTYTPTTGYVGSDTFTYSISDGHGGTATAKVSITVTAVVQNPVAKDDSATTPENVPVSVNVLANDSDPGNFPLSVKTVTTPTHGTASINGDNSITYTPTTGYVGSDTFTYSISDGHGGTATAKVSITVTAVIQNPLAKDDSATTPENVPVSINVLANDSDPGNFPLTVKTVTTPAHGTASINADNSITYTPSTGYVGSDTFNYSISDGHGGTATAKVSVTVTAVIQNPVAKDDSATTPENVAVNVNVLANDSDPGNFPLSVTTVTLPAHGTASINADNSITYTPSTGYVGSDTFTYSISDGHGGTATAKVSITVTAVIQNPVAKDDSATTPENVAVNVNVLANDSDPGNFPLSVTTVTAPSHGTASINADNSITYTPTTAYVGSDTFNYSISDGHGGTATAKVSITVTAVHHEPVANNDTASTRGTTPVNINVLANDTDVDGNALTVTTLGVPAHGTATINPDGSVRYQAQAAFFGTDVFTYSISDGHGGSASAKVTVTVIPDLPPLANNFNTVAMKGEVTDINVLAHASDPYGLPLSVIAVDHTGLLTATVSINQDGTVRYIHSHGTQGYDYFTYTVSDGHGNTATGTVTVFVEDIL